MAGKKKLQGQPVQHKISTLDLGLFIIDHKKQNITK
jgi:hypothetical protein